MPRRSKGARLYPQPARRDETGAIIEGAVWVIRDGTVKRSTGIGVEDDQRAPVEAERKLGEYLATKHAPSREGPSPVHKLPIADVINVYIKDKAHGHARPEETAQRARALIGWWGDKTLSQVTGATCRAYAETRTLASARRELQDLAAAIKHHRKEGLHREIVEVVLPERGVRRERWLTRSEAARLLSAAWRYREVQKGHATGRRSRRHVARFILVAIYTGTRAGAVCGAALAPTEGKGWINLDTGVFYRRPEGERETKKRKPPVRLPTRLLAHLRRWNAHKICREFVVEWNGRPVLDVDKAFRNAVRHAGLSSDVTPHVLKHTAITWGMQNGMTKEDAAQFFGTTIEVIQRHYWHHHPDFQADAAARMGWRPRQDPDRKNRNKRSQTPSGATNVSELAKAG